MGSCLSKPRRLVMLVAAMKRGEFPNAQAFAAALKRDGHRGTGKDAVCAKTIQRDIQHLQAHFHAPIEYDESRHGYSLTDPQWSFPYVELSGDTLFTAIFCARLSQAVLPEPWREQAESAMSIQLAAGSPEDLDPEVLNAVVFATGAQPALTPEVFDTVSKAWRTRHRLRAEYQAGSGETTTRDVDVHAMFLADGAWYARVYCHMRKGVRSLALHRLRNPQILDQRFQRQDRIVNEIRQGHVFDYGMVRNVVMRCGPEKAQVLREREWFRGQKAKELPGGWLELRFPEAPRPVLIWWVLSYAGNIEVVAPTELRHEVWLFGQMLMERHRRIPGL